MKGVNINAFNQETAKRNLTATAKKMLIKNQKLDISVLAKESGMTRQSFYYHFSCCDELFSYAIEMDMKKLKRKIRRYRGWEALRMACDMLYEEKDFYRRVSTLKSLSSARSEMSSSLFPLLRKTAGEILEISEENTCCEIAADTIMGSITRWLTAASPDNPQAFILKYKNMAFEYAKGYLNNNYRY